MIYFCGGVAFMIVVCLLWLAWQLITAPYFDEDMALYGHDRHNKGPK